MQVLLLLVLAFPASGVEACTLCDNLNTLMMGDGVLVRRPDGFQSASVAASLWHIDIKVPNIMWNENNEPVVGVVIGTHKTDIIPQPEGGHIFYAHDANSCDNAQSDGARCRFEGAGEYFNCPGRKVKGAKNTGPGEDCPSCKGPGDFLPYVGFGNTQYGGAGCAWSTKHLTMAQISDGTSSDLISGGCGCNPDYENNWDAWIDHWISIGQSIKTGNNWQGGDQAICWITKQSQMIQFQNTLWKRHAEWLGTMDPSFYWGWNEIPVEKAKVDEPANWDAYLIYLPLRAGSLSQLGSQEIEKIHADIVNLVPNPAKIVLANERLNSAKGPMTDYSRWFFCEDFTSTYFSITSLHGDCTLSWNQVPALQQNATSAVLV